MFCASRHSIISIAFFRQRLNGKETRKGGIISYAWYQNKFRDSLTQSSVFYLIYDWMLKPSKRNYHLYD